MSKITKGSCNCGSVTWQVEGEMRPITACHCQQCQKQTGFYVAASAAKDEDLTIKGEALNWYQSSAKAKRGFCSTCGSCLFWKHDEDDTTSIMAGSIDGLTGLSIGEHIFVADKSDYYEIYEDVPKLDTWE